MTFSVNDIEKFFNNFKDVKMPDSPPPPSSSSQSSLNNSVSLSDSCEILRRSIDNLQEIDEIDEIDEINKLVKSIKSKIESFLKETSEQILEDNKITVPSQAFYLILDLVDRRRCFLAKVPPIISYCQTSYRAHFCWTLSTFRPNSRQFVLQIDCRTRNVVYSLIDNGYTEVVKKAEILQMCEE